MPRALNECSTKCMDIFLILLLFFFSGKFISEKYLGNKCTINWLFFPLFSSHLKKGEKNERRKSSQTGFQTVFLIPKNYSPKNGKE